MKYALVFALLLPLQVSCTPTPAPAPKISPIQVLAVMTGEVIAISPVWTMNGDGGITIKTINERLIQVSVRGYPAMEPETKINLKSVKYINELKGRTVQVKGQWREDHISADIITEM